MIAELLEKLLWLVQTLVNAGPQGLSFKELSDACEDRFGVPYPRRTFNNHREETARTFGIEISCNRSTNRYFIESGAEALDRNDSKAWLIDTFTIRSMLSLAEERLSGRISVEEVPSGHRFLTPLVEAMKENSGVRFEYHKYGGGTELRSALPYALKEYRKRWYLIGHDTARGAIRVYGLDRVVSLEKTGERFAMPEDFNVDELFRYSFGIYLPDGKTPEVIRLKAETREASYLRDLPIHHSQMLEEETPESAVFALYAVPDDNLVMEICSRGASLEVIEPESLRQKVKDYLSRALSHYGPLGATQE